jgi:parallel beta-helix repeat protein
MNRNEKHRKFGCLKRTVLIIGLALGIFSAPAAAQVFVFRVDPTPVLTTRNGSPAPAGGFPALYVVPGATIKLCTDATCVTPATTYTNSLGNVTCPTSAQVTLPGSSLCTSTAGFQGQFGFWIQPGTYYYQIFATTGTFGPFPLSSPTLGTLGGPGTVSVNGAGGFSVIAPVQDCLHATGASGGAQIISCIAALSTGGTADARGIAGAQNIPSTITVPSNVRLLLGPAVFTSAVTANSNIFTLNGAGASIECVSGTQILAATDTNGIGITAGPASVKNCTLTGPNLAMSVLQGINSSAVQDVEITGNIVEKWGNGINTGTGHAPGNYWKITNNTVRLNNADGIFIPSDNNVIASNQVYSNQSNGIDINGSWNAITGNVVRRNGLGHAGSTDSWGILIAAVPGVDSNYNTVTGNTVDQSTGQGIIVKPTTSQNTNFNTIAGNVVTNSQNVANADGITLDGSSVGTVRGNAVTGNTVQGNARHGIVIDGTMGTVQENTVVGNVTEGNTNYGILITGGNALDNIVSSNISLSNGTNLFDNGSIRTIKAGNHITLNPGFWVDSASDDVDGIYFGNRTNGIYLTEQVDASVCLGITANSVPVANRFCVTNGGDASIKAGNLTVNSGVTVSSSSTAILNHLSGSAALTFNSGMNFAANTCYDLSGLITALGAAIGDSVVLGIPNAFMTAGLTLNAWVNSTNTVSVRVCNPTLGTVTNPGAQTFKVDVFNH